MMSDSEPPRESQAVVGAFLMRYLEDRENGEVQPLEVYQKAYKGYEEVIAREYSRLSNSETITEGGVKATTPATLGAPLGTHLEDESAPTGLLDAADEVEGYRLVRVLGEGGMGTVYLARQEHPIKRDVALKVIKLGMDTREVVARFDMERQALALMDHPNIATVYDAGHTRSGRPYFAMEHFEGTPITSFCDREKLDVQGRIRLVIDACDAMQHAHQKGVIHRDLKPSNILVALRQGRPTAKIIDFGIAKSTREPLTERTLETQLGQLVGTPAYMSPEQAAFDALDIDTRADIYALGMILYELLVGALPFEPRSARDLGSFIQQIIQSEPARPSTRLTRLGDKLRAVTSARRTDVRELAGRLRGDLDWITMKSIEKDRDRRYGSASELADDLRRHLAHEPVLARAPTFTYRAGKFIRRRRKALTVSAVVIVLLAGSAFAAHFASEERTRRERVEASRATLQDAEFSLERHHELKDSLQHLEERWRHVVASYKGWEPAWRRADEIEPWRAWREAIRTAEILFSEAVTGFDQVRKIAPPDSAEAARATEMLSAMLLSQLESRRGGEQALLDATYWDTRARQVDPALHRKEFQDRGRVRFLTEPPGADVYCFRYRFHERELRLLPLPYQPPPTDDEQDPDAGFVGKPVLEVERVSRAANDAWAPFVPGDRLVEIDGSRVGDRGELADQLFGVKVGESVPVRVERKGRLLDLSWIPYPEEADKARWQIPDRFVRFGGYPLDFVEACRVGTTGPDEQVTVDLPAGSYLMVFRLAGYRDTRFPVAVPLRRHEVGTVWRVRLLREAEVPPGFEYVPSGPVAYGGDSDQADQSLRAGYEVVDGFFMSRLEVTFGEYLEFLNDPANLGRIGENGGATALADWDQILVENIPLSRFVDDGMLKERLVDLIPRQAGQPLLRKTKLNEGERWKDQEWRLRDPLQPEWPVLGVSRLAAIEYIHWRGQALGGRWKLRLPTDLEWEKAARGVDRRLYVWGDYPVFSFCRTSQGIFTKRPGPVGSYPTDESIFGVRDLAGSAGEPTLGRIAGLRLLSYRGGDWYHVEDSMIMIANRNGWPPEGRSRSNGIRLVAELEPE